MLSFPAEREFIDQLCSIQNAYSGRLDKLELIKSKQRAHAASEKFEEAVAEFILRLLIPNQVQALDFILNKLVGEDCAAFNSIPWWVGETTGYKNRVCYAKEDVIAYANIIAEEFNSIYHDLALAISAGESNEKMAHWKQAIDVLKDIPSYYHEDLTRLSQAEIDWLSQEMEEEVFSIVVQEIAFKEYDHTVLHISQFYSSVLSGDYKPNQTAHLKWVDDIQGFCHEISRGSWINEKEGSIRVPSWDGQKLYNEEFVHFLKIIKHVATCRYTEVHDWLNPSSGDNGIGENQLLFHVLPWQGSKTELAELGYALLEAGFIGGPREAALKTLADFFGQDLGNPAKHLQTLQKRKWSPNDREPTTPMLDKLGVALKKLLRGKGIAPSRK